MKLKTIRAAWVIASAVVFLWSAGTLYAQSNSDEEESKSWVLHYIKTATLVNMGIGVVGQGSNREVEEERKLERKEAAAKEARLKKLEAS